MNKFYRPQWTVGRFHHDGNRAYSLLYNLLEGISFFFEDESAIITNAILQISHNAELDLETLHIATGYMYSDEEVKSFCDSLVEVGLLTDGIIDGERLKSIRKAVGESRRNKSVSRDRSIQETLPFYQQDPENTYMEILEKDRVPFCVIFELTYNCNEMCVHCFNPGAARNAEEKSMRNDREEIDLAHYEKLLDDLKQLGTVKIILTGGDPFVKRDIWKLIQLIYDRGFAFDVYTNGLALLGRTQRLAEFFPLSVGLSVYSAIPEVHDGITRVRNSLKKTLAVAEEFVEHGVPLYFKCPIMINNARSYHMVSDLAKQYGAAAQIDISLSDAVDGDTAISEQLQVDGELLEIILRDPNVPLYVGPEVPGYGQQQKNPAEAFCGAGTVLMSITPEGDVTPCNSFPTQFGNLRNNSFREIWDGSEQLNRWQKVVINDYEECGTHERCNYCSRCPGQSFIEHGTPLKASMANCYMANTRMQLAQKLQAGNDPLQGKELGERLLEAEIHQNAVVSSNKESANHRNKSLDLSTMRH